ncbi:MAG: hypothetical protein V2A74_14540 [bacterium]
MKKVLLSLLVAVLIVAGASGLGYWWARESYVMAPPSADALKDAIELALRPTARNISRDRVLILADQTTVTLQLIYRNDVAVRFGLKPEKERFSWSATHGPLNHDEGKTSNVWQPPIRGGLETVTVRFRGVYSLPHPFFNPEPVIVDRDATLKALVPISGGLRQGSKLDGFELGEYLDPLDPEVVQRFKLTSSWPHLHPDKFTPPRYFYRVAPETKSLFLSQRFKLGDFALDFPWFSLGLPQYVAVDSALLNKLEDLLDLMNRDGYALRGFTPIYGFRPPCYNLGTIERDGAESLKVPFSFHQYGKALDFIIDLDNDLVMDDLNHDGMSDTHDSAVILHYVNILDREYREAGSPLVGGAGLYDYHDFHERIQSPYIHVDVRGFTSPEGLLIRWPDKWPDGNPIEFGKI